MNTYYLPIKSPNLSKYFSYAIIAPVKYFPIHNEDIQSIFDSSLLFCNKRYTNVTNCSLEVVLTDEEYKSCVQISSEFHLFSGVVPISRVKAIYFSDDNQRRKTRGNINLGAAFIPDRLTYFLNDNDVANVDQIKERSGQNESTELADKLDLFNRILGGFACMKIGGNSWMNYPKNYFPTLAFFNGFIRKELQNQNIKSQKDYTWLFNESEKFKEIRQLVYGKVTSVEVTEYAQKENILVTKKLGSINLDEINPSSQTYGIAILASYGEGSRKKLDDFISDLVSGKLNPERKEGLSLITGINKGYSSFLNKYRTANFEVNIKFELNSQVDYYTIESVYQHVFNGAHNDYNFEYIDEWCPKSTSPISDDYITYKILDKHIIYDKKPEASIKKPEVVETSPLNNFYKVIVDLINSWLPECFRSKDEASSILFFKNKLDSQLQSVINREVEKRKLINQDIFHQKEVEYKQTIDQLQNSLNEAKQKIIDLKDKVDYSEKSNNNELESNLKNEVKEQDQNSGKQGTIDFEIINKKENNDDSNSISDTMEKRIKELESYGIRKLISAAKELGIEGKFDNNDFDKEKLRRLIINKEFKTEL